VQGNTSGSAASNITFSSPGSLMNRAGTSLRHDSTCSVIPSDFANRDGRIGPGTFPFRETFDNRDPLHPMALLPQAR
jgi:hypothetical protein